METNLKLSPAALAKTEHEITVSLTQKAIDLLEKYKWKDESEIISESMSGLCFDEGGWDEDIELLKEFIDPKDKSKKRTFILSPEDIQDLWEIEDNFAGRDRLTSFSVIINFIIIHYLSYWEERKELRGK